MNKKIPFTLVISIVFLIAGNLVGDKRACINAGIPYLKNFVMYIEQKRYKNIDLPYGKFQSPWEKKFFEVLISNGYAPVAQEPAGPYFIDIALKAGSYKLAIEVDGQYWHTNLSGNRLERDLVRDHNLRKMGWDVIRFWVHDLKYDLQKCLEVVEKKIDQNK